MKKNEKTTLIAIICLAPYGVGAAFQFLPLWVAWPTLAVLILLWLGALAMIGNDHEL